MTEAPSPRLQADLALARAVRARRPGAWRPCWGRIAAIGFSMAVWGLVGWGLSRVWGAWS